MTQWISDIKENNDVEPLPSGLSRMERTNGFAYEDEALKPAFDRARENLDRREMKKAQRLQLTNAASQASATRPVTGSRVTSPDGPKCPL